MVKQVIARCNKCGAHEDTQEFTITHNGESREIDLCPEHAGPLVEAFELGDVPEKPTAKPRKSTRSSHSVVAIEDWKPEGQ